MKQKTIETLKETETQAQAVAETETNAESAETKTRATYNEKLNERGTTKFLMRRNINKEKQQVNAACFFIPNAERAQDLKNKFNFSTPAEKLAGCFVCMRNNAPVLAFNIETGVCAVADYSTQTARGVRLHEKLKEGVESYFKDFHKGVAVVFNTDSDFTPMRDSFQTSGGAGLTLEDIMDL